MLHFGLAWIFTKVYRASKRNLPSSEFEHLIYVGINTDSTRPQDGQRPALKHNVKWFLIIKNWLI